MEEYDKFWDKPTHMNIGCISVVFLILMGLPSRIEGFSEIMWRDYFPFTLISSWHPDMDTYNSDETIVRKHGFHIEKHYVKTEDGYINYLVNLKDDKIG